MCRLFAGAAVIAVLAFATSPRYLPAQQAAFPPFLIQQPNERPKEDPQLMLTAGYQPVGGYAPQAAYLNGSYGTNGAYGLPAGYTPSTPYDASRTAAVPNVGYGMPGGYGPAAVPAAVGGAGTVRGYGAMGGYGPVGGYSQPGVAGGAYGPMDAGYQGGYLPPGNPAPGTLQPIPPGAAGGLPAPGVACPGPVLESGPGYVGGGDGGAFAPYQTTYYYFRPYNPAHVARDQAFVARFGGDPRNPYSNDFFQLVYAGYRSSQQGPNPAETIPVPQPRYGQ